MGVGIPPFNIDDMFALTLTICLSSTSMANPQTNDVDLRGFDSSRFLNLRGGIPRSIGNIPEIESLNSLA